MDLNDHLLKVACVDYCSQTSRNIAGLAIDIGTVAAAACLEIHIHGMLLQESSHLKALFVGFNIALVNSE